MLSILEICQKRTLRIYINLMYARGGYLCVNQTGELEVKAMKGEKIKNDETVKVTSLLPKTVRGYLSLEVNFQHTQFYIECVNSSIPATCSINQKSHF
jgi:hypothetical protein